MLAIASLSIGQAQQALLGNKRSQRKRLLVWMAGLLLLQLLVTRQQPMQPHSFPRRRINISFSFSFSFCSSSFRRHRPTAATVDGGDCIFKCHSCTARCYQAFYMPRYKYKTAHKASPLWDRHSVCSLTEASLLIKLISNLFSSSISSATEQLCATCSLSLPLSSLPSPPSFPSSEGLHYGAG